MCLLAWQQIAEGPERNWLSVYKNTIDILDSLYKRDGVFHFPDTLTVPELCETFFRLQENEHDDLTIRYHDYSVGGRQSTPDDLDGTVVDYTRAQVNTRIKAVAARLQQVCSPGDRAAILLNNSPEYIFAFLGAIYAGLIPLPLYDPAIPSSQGHLKAIFEDATPNVVLTNRVSAPAIRRYFSDVPAAKRPRAITIDALPDSLAAEWVPSTQGDGGASSRDGEDVNEGGAQGSGGAETEKRVAPVDLPVCLQYTSGSTGTPKGVILTHRAVLTSVLQMISTYKLDYQFRYVNWLPLHFDMGIIFATLVVSLGYQIELMGPQDFLQQPKRWIWQMGNKGDGVFMHSAAPNFALELVSRFAADTDADLSSIRNLALGGEPITQKSLNTFVNTFAKQGLSPNPLLSGYGLAEATLSVTSDRNPHAPSVIGHFDRKKLTEGKAEFTDDPTQAMTFVSVGQTQTGDYLTQYVTIVDPQERCELPDGQVGEIWAQGDNIAAGYYHRPQETEDTFHNVLAERLDNSRVEGATDDGWLATGDLGAVVDGQFYVVGRIKDLVVIAGVNHYPQDLEATVSAAAPDHIQPGAVAAFSIPGDDVEKLVILAERKADADPAGDDTARSSITQAVSQHHGVAPSDVVIGDANSIARNPTGKIARRVARTAYIAQQES